MNSIKGVYRRSRTKCGSITLKQIILQTLRCYSSRIAVEEESGRTLSYAELDQQSDQVSTALRACNISSGDRVGFMMDNSLECAVVEVAALKLNAVKVPLSGMLSTEDIAFILNHSGTKVLFIDAAFQTRLPEALAAQVIVVRSEHTAVQDTYTDWNTLFSIKAKNGSVQVEDDPDAIGALFYTRGTTGKPKGVAHTQGALGLNLLGSIVSFDIEENNRMLLTTPLSHAAGPLFLACLVKGGTAVLHKVFNPDAILRTIQNKKISVVFLVPTMIYRLLECKALERFDLDSLKTIIYGAAPIDVSRLKEAIEKFGPIFIQFYGQAECSMFATTLSKEDHQRKDYLRSCGRPAATIELRIVEENSGRVLSYGEVGEIQVRAPYNMKEYYRAPTKTAEAFYDDWLRTGDLGYQLETGHLFFVDRQEDMILSGGLNIYSSEVEFFLGQHPGVSQIAVIGIPDNTWGESVHAVLVAHGDDQPTLKELKKFVDGKLADYKVPKSLSIVERLPLTPVGKIDKQSIRREFLADADNAIR